jgi:phosphate transport system substrate-binding protein
MKMKRTVRLVLTTAVVVTSALSLAAVPGLAGASAAKATDHYLAADTRLNFSATISGAGSTFAAPLENAAQALYQARTANATLNGYQAVGSGTGETDLLKGLVDWGGSDVPLAQSDINKDEPSGSHFTVGQFLQIPIGLGGVAIPYNVPGLKAGTTLTMTASLLGWIYEGKITRWNSSKIKALNPKIKLPNAKIVVVARGDSSGTTYIFTNFLHVAAPNVWKTSPSKTALTLPNGGIAGAGNAGVAADVQNTKNSIGYVEYSYLLLNPSLLRGVAAIINKSRKAVLPSIAGIALAAAARPKVSSTAFSIVYEPGLKSYPIAGYTWAIIFKSNRTNDHEGTLLVKYLDWLSHSGAVNGTVAGQEVAALQGYVPLPAKIQVLARTTLLKCHGSHDQTLLTTNGS